MDTTKATATPVTSITISPEVNVKPNFISFRRLAPNITGIARKKVNSVAAALETPINSAPIIVAPERDVPGNTAARS